MELPALPLLDATLPSDSLEGNTRIVDQRFTLILYRSKVLESFCRKIYDRNGSPNRAPAHDPGLMPK